MKCSGCGEAWVYRAGELCFDCKVIEKASVLRELSQYFGEPVMPLPKFCEALRTWMRCIEERNREGDDYPHGRDYHHLLDRIDIDISKSNLLARLLYSGEKLRTKRCPEHDGHWSGIMPCEHGCGQTGWVPDGWPEDADPCSYCGAPAVAVSVSASGRTDLCYAHYMESWERKLPPPPQRDTP